MAPDESRKSPPAPRLPERAAPVVRYVLSDLLRGGREAIIDHDGSEYRLRITANGRLILTK